MKKNVRAVPFKLAAAMLVCTCFLSACGSDNTEASTELPTPVLTQTHDIHELMTVVLDVQADLLWEASATVIDENGEHDLAPDTDEGWLQTQSAAATLATMGNLLQTPVYAKGRGADWLEFSRALSAISLQAEEAVKQRDKQQILEVGVTMFSVCVACHEQYLVQEN